MKNRQFLLPQEPSTGNFERNRRRREKRILLAMVELQCRNHDKEGKKPLCEHLNKEKESYFQECFQKEPGMQQMHLCAECFQTLHNGGRSIHHCRHMGYKTLCHHCPTPCHGQRLKTELRKLMQVRKHLFFHHPVKTMIHMGDLLRAKGIQHKERKKK